MKNLENIQYIYGNFGTPHVNNQHCSMAQLPAEKDGATFASWETYEKTQERLELSQPQLNSKFGFDKKMILHHPQHKLNVINISAGPDPISTKL